MISAGDSVFIFLILACLVYLYFKQQGPYIPHATPKLPIVGNAPFFRRDPIQFLASQRSLHGDQILVDLGVVRMAFFLGPDGTNAVIRATEASGVSLYKSTNYFLGKSFEKGIILLFFTYFSSGCKRRDGNCSSYHAFVP